MCLEYAKKEAKTRTQHIKQQNQCIKKAIKDSTWGKIAEVYVCKYLRSLGKTVSDPDFNIYAVGNKTFDPDLTCGQYDYEVKVHTGSRSWVFNAQSDHSHYDYAVFVGIKTHTKELTIEYIVHSNRVKKILGNPHNRDLIGLKKVVYGYMIDLKYPQCKVK